MRTSYQDGKIKLSTIYNNDSRKIRYSAHYLLVYKKTVKLDIIIYSKLYLTVFYMTLCSFYVTLKGYSLFVLFSL